MRRFTYLTYSRDLERALSEEMDAIRRRTDVPWGCERLTKDDYLHAVRRVRQMQRERFDFDFPFEVCVGGGVFECSSKNLVRVSVRPGARGQILALRGSGVAEIVGSFRSADLVGTRLAE